MAKRPASPAKRRARATTRSAPRAKAASRKRSSRRTPAVLARAGSVTVSEVAELDALRRELERAAGTQAPLRWNADPDEVRRSVAQLVLTLVEFVRRLLERQAIRRMNSGSLTARETEDVGRALMQLEAAVREIAAAFGLDTEELNLDLGPAGTLM